MFFVFNKQKIYTYLVSIVTVVLLFCIAGSLNNTSRRREYCTNSKYSRKIITNLQRTNRRKKGSLYNELCLVTITFVIENKNKLF